jgi:LuxR family quorum sensing-dependent transcriptional regulator
MRYRVLETIERLQQAKSPEEVIQELERNLQFQSSGVNHFAFNMHNVNGEGAKSYLGGRVNEEWLALWMENNYYHVCPGVRHSFTQVRPFKYEEAPYCPEKEPHRQEFIERAKDFDTANGIIFPMPGPQRLSGFMWCNGKIDERYIPILETIGTYAFYRLKELKGPIHLGDPLSERELEILKWAANGKTAWEVGAILAISKRTVEWHFTEACRKLGAVNKVQAVSLAIQSGLIAI